MAQSTDNPFVIFMLIVIFILGIAITLLANVLIGAAQYRRESPEDAPADADAPASNPSNPTKGDPKPLHIAGVGAALATPAVNGVSDTAFYLLISVVILEVFVIMALLYNLRLLIGRQKAAAKKSATIAVAPAKPRISLWARLNGFKTNPQEAEVDTGHEYDGIRELDNKLPPWWLYGFYCTVIFAGVYLWRYHVSHSAPLPAEEYRIALHNAEIQKAEYLKKTANNIDETSVTLLTAPADIAAGKAVFQSTCFACHGKNGEGGVGPNLTDEYWLHGGSINDVFKTIKYGWPDKGMKSWKDDYSPSQIAQIASYVKSLGGSHPDNPKPPQGTVYKQ
jgi:cytochrome c oxidase cbb3-type subunit 3